MSHLRDSLSTKLTVMNLVVSAVALLLASASFFAYDLITFRDNLVRNISVQAQIIGSNAVSPLIFDDPQSAENTLAALRASPNILYASVYKPDREFFAGYPREQAPEPFPFPAFNLEKNEEYQFENRQFALVQTVSFQGKNVGIVYIRSDLRA